VPGVGEGAAGRRSRAQTRQGRTVRSSTDTSGGLHLLGTVFAAAPHQHSRGRAEGPLKLTADDLRGAYREGREGNLVVFVVDASGSMAARDRLSAVTGAVVAVVHRERVRDPRRRPMLVLLTDGRATGGVDPVPRAHAAANLLAAEAITSIVVDCERGMVRLGLAVDLARTLRAGYLQLAELTGDSVADIVRAGSGRLGVTRAA
jgi:magnesium chelatase subunit D